MIYEFLDKWLEIVIDFYKQEIDEIEVKCQLEDKVDEAERFELNSLVSSAESRSEGSS